MEEGTSGGEGSGKYTYSDCLLYFQLLIQISIADSLLM